MNRFMKFAATAALTMGIVALSCVTAFAATPGKVKSSNVNVRKSADASSDSVGAVNTGDSVSITDETTGADGKTWYKVTLSSGTEGYIRSDFVTKSESDSSKKEEPATNVTAVDKKDAYIEGTGTVNIRKNASKTSAAVATAKGQSKVTVVGEATAADGYKWYQIEFKGNGETMTGFVRSDLLTFTAPVSEPAETEVTGTVGGEVSEEPEEVSEEPEEVYEEPEEVYEEPEVTEETVSGVASVGEIITEEPIDKPEGLPKKFEQVPVRLCGNTVTAYNYKNFFVVYGTNAEGEKGWYVYDSDTESFISYVNLFDNTSGSTGQKIVIIILAALVLILAAVVVVLLIKKNGSNDDDDYYYDDDDDEEDDEDDEEDDEPEVVTRASRPAPSQRTTAVPPVRSEATPVQTRTATAVPIIPQPVVNQNPVQPAQPLRNTSSINPVQPAPAPSVTKPEVSVNDIVAYMDTDDDYEEEETPKKSKKDKTEKKAKKGFGKKLLDYFTVEVEDEDEDDYDEYEDIEPSDDNDDDDDFNFIDL